MPLRLLNGVSGSPCNGNAIRLESNQAKSASGTLQVHDSMRAAHRRGREMSWSDMVDTWWTACCAIFATPRAARIDPIGALRIE